MRDLVLIPPKYIEKEARKRKKIIASLLILASIIIAALLIAFPFMIKSDLMKEKSLWDNKISTVDDNYIIGQQYDSLVLQYNQRENLAKKLKSNGIELLTILSHLEKSSPKNLSILSISISYGADKVISINLNGVAATNADIATFVNSLEKDKHFSSINISSVTVKSDANSKTTNYSFIMGAKINSGM